MGNDDLVEVCVSDNTSEDDTQEIVRQLQERYRNLRYQRHPETIEGNRNIQAAVKMSCGEYVVSAGDDDYVMDDILYRLIDYLYRHRDKALVYLMKATDPTEHRVYEGEGCLDYLDQVSFYSTFISAVVMKRDLYDRVEDPEQYAERNFAQVYVQMEILKMNPRYTILYEPFWRLDSGEASMASGNLFTMFVKYYFDILTETVDVPPELLSAEKKRVVEKMLLPWCQIIKGKGLKMSTDGASEILYEYYGDEPYYPAVITALKEILGEDYN